jgi:hypothetical protein
LSKLCRTGYEENVFDLSEFNQFFYAKPSPAPLGQGAVLSKKAKH